MEIDGKVRTWAQGIAAGFLCVGAAVSLAMAGGHHVARAETQTMAESVSNYIPPGMHEAQADKDVGPGSDEAQLVNSPWASWAE